ncbi:hypothetical protein HJG60_010835 [Phyllostomus discolor]|uniref:Uncharacterized protein n=1 Tax=Phyllostomus discolor TaxID=89673 RepID=A0A834ECQ5_9CHIR|nr:hypothetical protein HJG60_010835 [Phyllostomus discolor]
MVVDGLGRLSPDRCWHRRKAQEAELRTKQRRGSTQVWGAQPLWRSRCASRPSDHSCLLTVLGLQGSGHLSASAASSCQSLFYPVRAACWAPVLPLSSPETVQWRRLWSRTDLSSISGHPWCVILCRVT